MNDDFETTPSVKATRVLVADDEKLLADALSMVIGAEPGFELAGRPVYSPDDIITACERLRPDVALIDLVYNGVIAGILVTARVRDVSPATQVVVMTSHEDPHLLLEAVEAGAAGFLKKTEAIESVIRTLRGVAAGEVMIESHVLARLIREAAREGFARPGDTGLTEREQDVLVLLRSGLADKEMAEKFAVSLSTVETHVQHILEKLGAHSRLEAVVIAGSMEGPTT